MDISNNNYNNLQDNIKEKLSETYKKLNITFQNEILFDNKGVDGFSFIIPEETVINLKSNVTDYTLQDNSVIQSGISPQPRTIRLTGQVGELFIKAPLTEQASQNVIQAGLNEVSAFLPRLSASAQQYYNKATNTLNKLENVYNTAEGAFEFLDKLVSNGDNKTFQQKTFEILESIWASKALFAIETEYKIFDNCVLEGVSITQGAATKYASNIELEIKQLTFAKNINTQKAIKINKMQKSNVKNNGTINVSILTKIIK